MKQTLTLALMLSFCRLSAQDWFPIGANWYYNQVDWLLMGETFQYFEVIGDTTIQNKYCRAIEGICQCSELGSVNYLHVDGEQVYYYDGANEVFRILYDFSLAPGDTLRYFSENFGETKYVLDSISVLVVNGYPLRVQHFQYVEGILELGTTVYELIGSFGCLYPQIGVCDPDTGGLRCYEDSIIGLQKFIDIDIPCDHITSSTKDVNRISVRVYPSPAEDYVIVESPMRISMLELINIQTGHLVFHSTCSQYGCRIERNSVPPGTYVIRVMLEDNSIQQTKVVMIQSQ